MVIFRTLWSAIIFCLAASAQGDAAAARLHYAPNGNFGPTNAYVPGRAGFNLADVNSIDQIDALPKGVQGLVWVGQCGGVDEPFLRTVQGYIGRPNLFGFYLMDDPNPHGLFGGCAPERLKAEADWIHTHAMGTKTFIVLMNLGPSKAPSFANSYDPGNTHIDLFGFSPYPCRTELNGCDFDMIRSYVAAAQATGIPRDRMVPIYQTFGGGAWLDDRGGRFVMPTVEQEKEIIARWEALVPEPVFDFSYSWGSQRGDTALESASELQAVFAQHNNVK
jgi:hypothetical protein